MVCDMWSGLIMSSSVVSFRFAPRRLASPRSLLDRLQNWKRRTTSVCLSKGSRNSEVDVEDHFYRLELKSGPQVWIILFLLLFATFASIFMINIAI